MSPELPIRPGIALTPFQEGDQHHLVLYLNDQQVQENTANIPTPYTHKDADEWLAHVQQMFLERGAHFELAIRHEQHGLIGGIGCFMRTGLEGHRDEIGYWLAAPFRGQGIMPAAVSAYCQWLFSMRPNLARIEAKVYTHNEASCRVLEKNGFQKEGLMRKATKKNDRLIDTWLWAKIR
ncbi:MAG: GNAT family N-acetyltransferase [Saprospiraceae bacterium]|nr:GNAT family N-acetyltransferase [Saprospiraceae bacterium]